MGRKKRLGACELCEREEVETTVHHLIPKEMGGTFEATSTLCIPCHKQIHALYHNSELAVRLYTIPLLKEDEKIASFIKWVRKQPSSKLPKTRKSNELKN
ncbi:HNH endonuclease [Litchfieldia salsa]|uniref:HNH domain-containing protein n=1 Tax=Litchfieldia salsa TaxID=930152 RepID=A0A1H0UMP2_9BACI|nr:HNH endonuclease [Litchfieldia salsa]SDP67517.1 hypothetical protein SAMN05216565_10540 [Litchfieldia salsa]